ncbi:hypothetical protein HCB17_02140 [Salinispora arenicola]|uniref:hypothetical protein n=1 Tax=Salinispora arenicola TaxID=168697 RepID=UPI00169E1B2B|nr:hypothetical protein [Salinispora arenicola]NIL40098.1 hypothetical protein [Salinispora arenicola]
MASAVADVVGRVSREWAPGERIRIVDGSRPLAPAEPWTGVDVECHRRRTPRSSRHRRRPDDIAGCLDGRSFPGDKPLDLRAPLDPLALLTAATADHHNRRGTPPQPPMAAS